MVGDLAQCRAVFERLQGQCGDLLQGTAGLHIHSFCNPGSLGYHAPGLAFLNFLVTQVLL